MDSIRSMWAKHNPDMAINNPLRSRKPVVCRRAIRATVRVIRADEELMIARSVLRSGVAIITD